MVSIPGTKRIPMKNMTARNTVAVAISNDASRAKDSKLPDAIAGSKARNPTVARSCTISQPTATRPWTRREHASLFQRSNHHDRAGNGNGEPEDHAFAQVETEAHAEARDAKRDDRHLEDGAGHDDLADGHEIGEIKVQADTEHEEDDSDVRELSKSFEIGFVAGRKGSDDDAGGEVSHDRREPHQPRAETSNEPQPERHSDLFEQVEVFHSP